MPDTQRTAQELADECKRLVEKACTAYESVNEEGGSRHDKIGVAQHARESAEDAIDRLAALASQAEPAETRCPDCKGSEFVGFKRGVRCATCNGTGFVELTTTPAPAQAEQSEDGRDAARYRFSQAPSDDGFCVCWWDTNANRWVPFRSKAAADHHIDAAIAAKEQQP